MALRTGLRRVGQGLKQRRHQSGDTGFGENRVAEIHLIEDHNPRFIIQFSIGKNPLNRTDLRPI